MIPIAIHMNMIPIPVNIIHIKHPVGQSQPKQWIKLDIASYRTQIMKIHVPASDVEYFIIYHPALTYYARDYGLRQIAIEADGKEPSAKQLTQIIRQAREDGVRRILYQSQFPASAVEVIARDIDAQYVEVDPLREDVIANIGEITGIITQR